MRKASKVAKDLGIQFIKLKDVADGLGIKIGASTLLEYDVIDQLTEIIGKPILTKKEPKSPKGAFIGICFNPDTEKFELISVRLRKENMGMFEHKILSEHPAVFGGIINANKFFQREINENTVLREDKK